MCAAGLAAGVCLVRSTWLAGTGARPKGSKLGLLAIIATPMCWCSNVGLLAIIENRDVRSCAGSDVGRLLDTHAADATAAASAAIPSSVASIGACLSPLGTAAGGGGRGEGSTKREYGAEAHTFASSVAFGPVCSAAAADSARPQVSPCPPAGAKTDPAAESNTPSSASTVTSTWTVTPAFTTPSSASAAAPGGTKAGGSEPPC